MSDDDLVVMLDDEEPEAGFERALGGRRLWSARALFSGSRRARCPAGGLPRADRGEWTPSASSVGGAPSEAISGWRSTGGDRRLDYADGESFVVDAEGGWIRRRTPARTPSVPTAERLLGAPLALALAPRGCYLLHASAFEHASAAVVLTAASGVGKSTIAAAAARAGWRRLADDVLPVRMAGLPRVYADYPQPKLGEHDQPAGPAGGLPLAAVFVLDRDETCRAFERERLAPAAAAVELAGATVAARLFDRQLLGAHLEACAALCSPGAGAVRVERVRYPSDLELLPALLHFLIAPPS